jgi:transketolase
MKTLVRRTVEIAYQHKHPHLPGCLSALQVMGPIFSGFNPANDVFILSKGHAAVALYACLESIGFHPDLSKSHPERDPGNGITCTTGSLGHGLPMAVGIALAKSIRGEPGRVHVLLGDGECLEGTTWESLCMAREWYLPNLIVHIDANLCGALGDLPFNVAGRLIAIFPRIIHYYGTSKGSGVSFLNGIKDHKRVLTEDEYLRAMEELS